MGDRDACPPLVECLFAAVEILRRRGVDVATGAVMDATRALAVLDLADEPTVRASLRSVLIKQEAHLADFDHAFDLAFRGGWFGGADGHARDQQSPGRSSCSRVDGAYEAGTGEAAVDPGALAVEVSTAAADGDVAAMSELAARAVAMFGGDDESSPRRITYQVMRALDVANMLSAVLRRLRADGGLTDLELSLRRHEVARALEAFRRALAGEVDKLRTRQALVNGDLDELPVPVADRPVVELTATELNEVRRMLEPLARQLAAHVGRRRQPRATGRVDVRRTLRRSLESGGVPIDPVLRRRHPHRPDVVLLCDISGSVAEFAQFTFTLVHAIHEVLAGVHSFAFVGGIAETTDVFEDAAYDVPVQRLLERPGVVGLDGHSDYGAVFSQFTDEHLHLVGNRTTVIVTGDARSNFRDPGVDAFRSIAERARRVYWLDPEPRADWALDDSAMPDYAPCCDGVFEVSSVHSLADVIAELV